MIHFLFERLLMQHRSQCWCMAQCCSANTVPVFVFFFSLYLYAYASLTSTAATAAQRVRFCMFSCSSSNRQKCVEGKKCFNWFKIHTTAHIEPLQAKYSKNIVQYSFLHDNCVDWIQLHHFRLITTAPVFHNNAHTVCSLFHFLCKLRN